MHSLIQAKRVSSKVYSLLNTFSHQRHLTLKKKSIPAKSFIIALFSLTYLTSFIYLVVENFLILTKKKQTKCTSKYNFFKFRFSSNIIKKALKSTKLKILLQPSFQNSHSGKYYFTYVPSFPLLQMITWKFWQQTYLGTPIPFSAWRCFTYFYSSICVKTSINKQFLVSLLCT